MGAYPDLAIDVPMVPVDYITRAVGYLSQQEASLGKVFHFFNASTIAWHELWAIIQGLGYRVQKIGYAQWQTELEARTTQGGAKTLYAVLQMLLRSPNNLFFKRPLFDHSQSLAGLAGSGIVCPTVDATLIAKYFAYFQRIGYLPLPDAREGMIADRPFFQGECFL